MPISENLTDYMDIKMSMYNTRMPQNQLKTIPEEDKRTRQESVVKERNDSVSRRKRVKGSKSALKKVYERKSDHSNDVIERKRTR